MFLTFLFTFKTCEDDDEEGGGISIHNIGGVFIVIFVGQYIIGG